jgi:hypothetical protein
LQVTLKVKAWIVLASHISLTVRTVSCFSCSTLAARSRSMRIVSPNRGGVLFTAPQHTLGNPKECGATLPW